MNRNIKAMTDEELECELQSARELVSELYRAKHYRESAKLSKVEPGEFWHMVDSIFKVVEVYDSVVRGVIVHWSALGNGSISCGINTRYEVRRADFAGFRQATLRDFNAILMDIQSIVQGEKRDNHV